MWQRKKNNETFFVLSSSASNLYSKTISPSSPLCVYNHNIGVPSNYSNTFCTGRQVLAVPNGTLDRAILTVFRLVSVLYAIISLTFLGFCVSVLVCEMWNDWERLSKWMLENILRVVSCRSRTRSRIVEIAFLRNLTPSYIEYSVAAFTLLFLTNFE